MRCGFASTLPHPQSQFRWLGTVNGVALDTSWTQPASFAFWIPGLLMDRVVAVALLRSVPAGTQGDPVTIAEFRDPVPYIFGRTPGLIRYTGISFVGRFGIPNDFRAILGDR